MIITYRPELENPPMAKECSLGFSFLPTGNEHKITHVSINAGVTRDFSPAMWERIKEYDVTKRLLSLGALVVDEDNETAAPVPEPTSPKRGLADQKLEKALSLIEASFDIDQLKQWAAKDERIRVRNAVSKRIAAITEGNG